METPMAILSAKLFIPPRRAMLVPRPRLVERLTRGLQAPLTLISAPAGTSPRRALKTLQVLNYMGFHVIGRASLTTGALSSLEEIEARHGTEIEQIARSIFRGLQRRASLRPSIFMLALFRVEQMIWRNEKADSVSRRYWEEKGWLDPRRTFFVAQSASPLKVALARLLPAAITRFRAGY
jgi:hypothetical protein